MEEYWQIIFYAKMKWYPINKKIVTSIYEAKILKDGKKDVFFKKSFQKLYSIFKKVLSPTYMFSSSIFTTPSCWRVFTRYRWSRIVWFPLQTAEDLWIFHRGTSSSSVSFQQMSDVLVFCFHPVACIRKQSHVPFVFILGRVLFTLFCFGP